MRLVPLDAAFGIEQEEVARLFQPFITRSLEPEATEWRDEIRRRRRKILKRALRRLTFGWLPDSQRDEDTILAEYTDAWHKMDYASYSVEATRDDNTPWEWHGRHMFASDVGATRIRQLLLIRVIQRLQPRSVLEVGCGNGINLLLLACRFPEIEFTGIELTQAGHHAATTFQKREALPDALRGYAPEALPDPAAFRHVRFIQGNAAALPFPDASFDLVYTTVALEQMERIRHRALDEIARVTKGHALMVEPFAEGNRGLWPRLNVLRRNYFRGCIADLPRYGLAPRVASDDFPQESFLKISAVLSEKLPPARRSAS